MINKPIHIGFDAKRAFFSRSGLGNYSRDLIRILSQQAPQNKYTLFKHKEASEIQLETEANTSIVSPKGKFYKKFGTLWRTFGISKAVQQHSIDIYHGLSHDLPWGIKKSGTKTVVTVHDCIYKRYPELYDTISPMVYSLKQKYALRVADRVIAISEQTKKDIIHFYKVAEDKIDVVYQGCNAQFYKTTSTAEKQRIKEKYQLPERFILSVGTIEERKNLLIIFEAMKKAGINYPVLALGQSTKYSDKVKAYVKAHGLDGTFIHQADFNDFPSIYQMATCLVYPSVFEGFGIPILEALNSGTPVITTEGGVFPEVGGDAALYVKHGDIDAMASTLQQVINDGKLRDNMAQKGKQQALKFRDDNIAQDLLSVYQKLT